MSQVDSCKRPAAPTSVHTRKLCSCNALLALGRTDAVAAGAPAPDTKVFGVILLNSPGNTHDDFASYIHFFERHRGRLAPESTEKGEGEGMAPVYGCVSEGSPYFICADGAYAALKRYCAEQYSEIVASCSGSNTEEWSTFIAGRLCDALIGDMDSLSASQLMCAAGAGYAERVPAAAADGELLHRHGGDTCGDGGNGYPLFHDSVSSIPVRLLERIRRRRDARGRPEASAVSATPVDPLVVLPVSCQMTTDFEKCVALLQRLWALEVGAPDALGRFDSLQGFNKEVPLAEQSAEASLLAAECMARLPEATVTADTQAGDDHQEADRCRRLVESVTAPAPSPTEPPMYHLVTRVLPNVAVFGALGGRMDHEIGVISCLLRHARVFHLMAINKYNVLFSCWPDGVTQFVLPPSWSPPGLAAAGAYMCGIVPFGFLREMETAGLLWNVVKGRPDVYDGYTQTSGYRLAFDGLVSACNTVTSPVVTIDLRPLHCLQGSAAPTRCTCDPDAPSVNPPTLFTLGLPRACPQLHA
ncbi:hypothetical protein LSCM1_05937 [Leishmania martiniquensis]|uniref:Thiamin pyrophosphokinase thiamin-binding domain-containing protein n=1 Tax=Leishmania martiniquensis TaxID=1580590 RepID=A0A836HDE7_9TRYP|nr:hypothetical protein LSCM1_05937 [Leishmania martiniquensis]